MSADQEPTGPDKRDLLSAFDQVVHGEKEKARAGAAAPQRKRTGLAVIALCLLSLGGLGYIWLGRPAWLFSADQSVATTPAQQEATLRFGMYLERERILDFLDKHHRLPIDLQEAGDVEEGIGYQIVGDSSFVLTATLGSTSLSLSRRDDLQSFLKMTGMNPAPRGQ